MTAGYHTLSGVDLSCDWQPGTAATSYPGSLLLDIKVRPARPLRDAFQFIVFHMCVHARKRLHFTVYPCTLSLSHCKNLCTLKLGMIHVAVTL